MTFNLHLRVVGCAEGILVIGLEGGDWFTVRELGHRGFPVGESMAGKRFQLSEQPAFSSLLCI